MTDSRSRDTWTARDYPVLVAAAEHLDGSPGSPIQLHQLVRQLDMPARDVTAALIALEPYLQREVIQALGGESDIIVSGLTERGRRAAGLWPSEDQLTALVAALETAANRTDDPDERTRLERAGDALKGAPQRIVEGVLTAWLASQTGL